MGEQKRRERAVMHATGVAAPFRGARMMDAEIDEKMRPMLQGMQAVLSQVDPNMGLVLVVTPLMVREGSDTTFHMLATADIPVAVYAMESLVERHRAYNGPVKMEDNAATDVKQ